MNIFTHIHNHGDQKISPNLCGQLELALSHLTPRQSLPTRALRVLIIDELTHLGWSDRIKVSTKTNITVTSQFGDIGLCLQTGNMGRFYADILKLQTLFREDSIKAGIYVIPTKAEAKNIGSNIAHYDRFVEELNVFAKTITIPLIVFGFERG